MSTETNAPDRTDAVVIGAGIIGTAIAANLVEDDVDVVLVERGDFCGEASGANVGLVTTAGKEPGVLLDLGRRTVDLYASLGVELGYDIHFHQTGSLIVAQTPDELAERQALTERQQAVGLNVQHLSGEEARELEPMLPESVVGASFCPHDGTIYPFAAVAAYLKQGISRGMTYLARTEVTDIDTAGGRVRGVETTRGRIHTDHIINAAGAWAGLVSEMAGVYTPIIPVRGQVLVTEPITGLPERVILGIDPSIRGTWAGNGVIGSSLEYAGFEKRTTLEMIQAFARGITKMHPELSDVQVIRAWSGLRPSTPDEMLILGESPRLAGFYVAGGAFRNGMLYGPAIGETIRDLVVGRTPEIDLRPARPERFESAKVGTQASGTMGDTEVGNDET